MNQTSTNPILVSPLFCFKMKPSSFFIMFSVVVITLHLIIPLLVGNEIIKDLQKKQSLYQNVEYNEKISYVNPTPDYPNLDNDMHEVNMKYQSNYQKMPNSDYKFSIRNLGESQIMNVRPEQVDSHQIRYNMNNASVFKLPAMKMNSKNHFENHSIQNSFENFPIRQNKFVSIKNEEEFDMEKLFCISLSSQQLIVVCFITICLILFCMKNAPMGKCMIFSFSICNMINAVIYDIVVILFFSLTLYEELTKFNSQDLPEILIFFSIFIFILGFYTFWSALLIKVSKNVIAEKHDDKQAELVQENLA